MNYTRWRQMFLGFLLLNILCCALQLGFALGHLILHEYWGMCLSMFFSSINGWCCVTQYRALKRVICEEKAYVWRLLSTDSRILKEYR